MEEWRDIEGYEGLYQVSNEGNIRSLKFRKVKIIKPQKEGGGHFQVNLWADGTRNPYYVHVLVAEAFIPNPHGYTVVHHKNHDKSNNRVENLEWMDEKEHKGMHKAKEVYQYTLDGSLVAIWSSVSEAAKQLNFSVGHISECCKNKYKYNGNNIYKGFIWRYA